MRLLLLLFFVGLVRGHGVLPAVGTGGGGQQSYHRYQSQTLSAPGNQYFYSAPDGSSYEYGFDTGTGIYQSEQKHAGGQVVGKYGHTNPDGSYANVQYQAVQTGESGDGAAVYREGTGAYQAVQYGHTLPVQPGVSSETAQQTYDRKTDGSYSLNVQSRDQSRTETGTPDGQVQGGFSFIGDDGVQRSVSYSAGQQGFLATGDHIPKDHNTPGYAGAPAGATGGTYRTYASSSYGARGGTGHVPAVQAYSPGRVAPSTFSGGQSYSHRTSTQYRAGGGLPSGAVSGTRYQVTGAAVPQAPVAAPQPGFGTYKGAQTGRTASGATYSTYGGEYINEAPKPFSFSYDAGEHGRQETQDANGIVRGSYVVNSPDGTQKELTYQADDDGFHIVDEKVVSNVGGYAGGSAGGTGVGYSAGGATGGYSAGGATGGYSAGGATGGYTAGGATGGYRAGGASGGYSAGRTAGSYYGRRTGSQQIGTSYSVGSGAGVGAGQQYKPKSIHAGASAY